MSVVTKTLNLQNSDDAKTPPFIFLGDKVAKACNTFSVNSIRALDFVSTVKLN